MGKLTYGGESTTLERDIKNMRRKMEEKKRRRKRRRKTEE
jgi:hypothetical protein